MTPERWRQIEQTYHSTLEREERQRSSFLKEACAGDEELRQEVVWSQVNQSETDLIDGREFPVTGTSQECVDAL